MKFQQCKAVIFDLDGTLLYTLTDLANAVNRALAANGLPARSLDEVRRFVGNGIAMLVRRAVPEGTQTPLYEKVLADTRAEYARCCRETTAPYDGIPEMLTTLAERGFLLAVVSNKPDAQVKKLCADFFPQVHHTAGQKEGVPLKPDPAPLLDIMREMGCTTENTVYAGDSDVDILTAKNAGIPGISVLWGFRDIDTLKAAGGTTFAASPAELAKLFTGEDEQ